MRSRWSDDEAAGFVDRYGGDWGEALALRTYSSRLLGAEPDLVLHGGGNSSVKASLKSILGEEIETIFVKASGVDMATIEPWGHPGLDLSYLRRLRALASLDDGAMVDQLRTHLLRAASPTPSIETLVHAFLPGRFIDHTHADAILLLTNREDGEKTVAEALGAEVIVIPYVTPGFKLALAAAEAVERQPDACAMVWAHHGIVTWGETARESYESMIELVSRAEGRATARRAARAARGPAGSRAAAELGEGIAERSVAAWEADAAAPAPPAAPPLIAPAPLAMAPEEMSATVASCEKVVPQARSLSGRLPAEIITVVRGLLAGRTGDCDRPYDRVVTQVLDDPDTLEALLAPGARETLVTPPLTTDHLIRTKSLPLWIEGLRYDAPVHPTDRMEAAVEAYCGEYEGYLQRHSTELPPEVDTFDPRPRVVMIPGLGVICAGPDLRDAMITRDITRHTIGAKTALAAEGVRYRGLPEDELFRMEYRTLQHAKLKEQPGVLPGITTAPLRGEVALVTGAAGAIGTGICEGLLRAGALVAATDLPGAPLDTLLDDLGAVFPGRMLAVPLDVTDPDSVTAAFEQVVHVWGGVDLVISNAGIAAVAPLIELSLERYRTLEKVNVEGTLSVLAEAARLFRRQRTGGDVVLISTKNVFSPGANFGAYSSTKAAAHQLARIASLEFAADDVRVNMVAPDAVFGHGTCRSGLWAEVGPGRMKARGLDEAGLEAYYQSRNLLKAQVTTTHVANAVLFFATRQTPTTGATIPVDGGLPDSTPR